MEIYGSLMLVIGVLGLIFMSSSLFSILISFEFLILFLFFLISFTFLKSNVMELFYFLTMAVIESLTGLVILLLMVFMKGSDMMDFIDVF